MGEPYDTYRWQFLNATTTMSTYWGRVYDECYDLYQALGAEGNPNSGGEAYQMSTHFNALRARWGAGSTTFPGRCLQMFDYFNDNIGGGDFDMDVLLTAMLDATPEQITKFMGITQAYKVAVWDAPFNEEFYAALARGFKVWGA